MLVLDKKRARAVISSSWRPAPLSRVTNSESVHHKEEFVTVLMDQVVPLTPAPDSEFDLDVTLLEVADPGHLINMTDDGCGQTCEKSTCITGA